MTNEIKTLQDLAVKHSYYCSDTNYYSREAGSQFKTWAEFYEEFSEADIDIDMNLIFRWDIKKRDTDKEYYYMEVFMMHQRKGIFAPIHIAYINEADVPVIVEYMDKHWQYLKELWQPISNL